MLPEMVVVPSGKFLMRSADSNSSRHSVNIKYSFAISRRPISFEQWDFYCDGDADAHRPDGEDRGRGPIINVSWEDAEHYVTWLSIAAGRPYRLLSEAEWEYCCRAGSGEGISPSERLGVPNAFGLFDIDGSTRELVADAWHESYQGAPADGSAWEPNKDTMWRVVRGGPRDGVAGIVASLFRDSVHHLKRLDNVGFRVACGLD